jgi:mRNA-degrading endonuclease toxin of MazEF toxin-antitoxin module
MPGEIYWVSIEGADPHPAVVVSRESLNRGAYVLATIITSAKLETRRRLPNCVPLAAGECGLSKDCVICAESMTIVGIDEIDFDRGMIGALEEEHQRSLIRAIGYVIEGDCEPV